MCRVIQWKILRGGRIVKGFVTKGAEVERPIKEIGRRAVGRGLMRTQCSLRREGTRGKEVLG